MRIHQSSLGIGVGFVLLLSCVLTTRPAHARLTDAEACRNTILKESAKYVQQRTKILQQCNDKLVKAKDGLNDVAGAGCRTSDGKTDDKLTKIAAKLRAQLDKKCGGGDKVCGTGGDDVDLDDPALGWGAGGPFGGVCPDFEQAGCSNAIAECGDVADCLQCIDDTALDQEIDLLYADLNASVFGAREKPAKTTNLCQQTLARAAGKFILVKAKALGKCWAALDKGKDGFTSSPMAGCLDASGKTAAAIDKAESQKIAKICAKCGGPDKACDQTILTFAGTSVKGAAGEGSGGDLEPQGGGPLAIGFGAACPDVTLPHPPHVNCGTLDALASGTAPDVIENLEELVKCVDCVTEFKVDCLTRATVPHHQALPAECTASCGDGIRSGGELCDPSAGAPDDLCPTGGNGLETCNPDCTCPCPARFDFVPDPTDPASLLDVGWTGSYHDARLLSDATITVTVDACTNPVKPCGTCSFSGPVPNALAGMGALDSQRCSCDPALRCTADSDCAGCPCTFFFGSSLPMAAAAVPVCVLSEIAGPVSGTSDTFAGAETGTLPLVAHVFDGEDPDQPCPTCEGDAVANDGNLGGTCVGGARSTLPCDANATHPIPTFGVTSLDCPPLEGNRIANLELRLPNSTGNESLTIPAAGGPQCRAPGTVGQGCLCDTCNNQAATPCGSDAECVAVGATTCGGLRCLAGSQVVGVPCAAAGPFAPACGGDAADVCGVPGAQTRPNACLNQTCAPAAGANEGECTAGPIDLVCTPTETFRPCAADSDCGVPGDTCVARPRECFLDNGLVGGSVVATGAADPPVMENSMPTLASVFCVGPTSSGVVNDTVGLPGAGRLTLRGLGRGLP